MWCVLGPAQVRRYGALDRLTINNEIAGFKFATVGRIGHTPVSLASMPLFLTSQSLWISGAKHRRWRQAAAVAGRARVARAEA
jgi:hypothetical protein